MQLGLAALGKLSVYGEIQTAFIQKLPCNDPSGRKSFFSHVPGATCVQ